MNPVIGAASPMSARDRGWRVATIHEGELRRVESAPDSPTSPRLRFRRPHFDVSTVHGVFAPVVQTIAGRATTAS